jgi:hypothetical protein
MRYLVRYAPSLAGSLRLFSRVDYSASESKILIRKYTFVFHILYFCVFLGIVHRSSQVNIPHGMFSQI